MRMVTEHRPIGVTIIATLMIVFGLAEIATGVTHNFLGLISTTAGAAALYGGAVIGGLYAIAGALLFSMRRSMMWLSLAGLVLIVFAR